MSDPGAGAALGGLAVGYAPVDFLKVLLGSILIAVAAKTIAAQSSWWDFGELLGGRAGLARSRFLGARPP
jgi:uncharacterized membrane protein YfcA